MPLRKVFALFCFILVSGCAELPSIDTHALRAKDTMDPQGHLELLRQESEQIAGTPFVEGNKVDLLRDGTDTYPAMLAAIHDARQRIDMESFIFDEAEGRRFADALLERRQAGVEINLIYDSVGSVDTPSDVFDRMRSGGIRVLEYNPIDPVSIIDSSFNHRDHRKLLIIDGKIAFTGGVNISEVYRIRPGKERFLNVHPEDPNDPLPWRDTQVKIAGPVVAEFEAYFMQTWKAKEGDPLPDPPPTPTAKKGDFLVQAVSDSSALNQFAIYRSLLASIALAHDHIYLTTAFFVPPPDLAMALKKAARRGIRVRLILPGRTDGEFDTDLAFDAGRAYYEDLLEAGVEIYEMQNAILHAKTAVIDGIWSTVGSSNLDWRSVLFNDECNAVILGSAFGRKLEAQFRDDLNRSVRIDEEKWNDRSFWDFLNEQKARLIEYYL